MVEAVHEAGNGRRGVEEHEVELFAQATQVLRQRHGAQDPVLGARHLVLDIGIVQVGERPRLMAEGHVSLVNVSEGSPGNSQRQLPCRPTRDQT